MVALGATEFTTDHQELAGFPVRITTYRVGEGYHCRIDNVSPGATIARASGSTAIEARDEATTSAQERLLRTRRRT